MFDPFFMNFKFVLTCPQSLVPCPWLYLVSCPWLYIYFSTKSRSL